MTFTSRALLRPALILALPAMITAALWLALGRNAESGAATAAQDSTSAAQKPRLAIFTSLPLFWSEETDLAATLTDSSPPHWWRSRLEADYVLQPLDALMSDAPSGPSPLAGFGQIILAQPRPLAPREMVNFDDWLRAGGKALVFADPALTWDSRFSLGDKRRPADMIMISPLLTRWGLELTVGEGDVDAAGEITLPGGERLPLARFGRFLKLETAPATEDDCRIAAGGVLAMCSIGKGQLLLVADAALLEPENVGHAEAANRLMEMAFE